MKTPSANRKHRDLLVEKQGGKCCYCGEYLQPADARIGPRKRRTIHPRAVTIEHLHRKVDGGGDSLDNKAAACFECNNGRGSLDWLTYKSIKMGEIAA